MNGNPGDEPYLDIVAYNLPVFSDDVDHLVRQIGKLMTFNELQDFREELQGARREEVPSEVLQQRFQELKEQLVARAVERGWEVDSPPEK